MQEIGRELGELMAEDHGLDIDKESRSALVTSIE
jgi:hypothetical protein